MQEQGNQPEGTTSEPGYSMTVDEDNGTHSVEGSDESEQSFAQHTPKRQRQDMVYFEMSYHIYMLTTSFRLAVIQIYSTMILFTKTELMNVKPVSNGRI
jgi:hypothetical protein